MAGTAQFINKLREKPEPVRRQIVAWTAILLTVIIFFFWLYSLTPNVPAPAAKVAAKKAESAPGPVAVFFGFIKSEVGQILNGGQVLYQKVK